MIVAQHMMDKAWAFQALDELEAFLEDPDFEGNAEAERQALAERRQALADHKYRVVVLGAFNVGKSMMINALLGDAYLPTVLEECTTKPTYVLRGEPARTVLELTAPLTEEETESLAAALGACGIGAAHEPGPAENEITIHYAQGSSDEVVKSLHTLVTMNATEEFPQLEAVRTKLHALRVYLPTERIEDDIVLIDSPGVHSITELHAAIAEEVVPKSHLILYLIDGNSAANEQSRAFIERVVTHGGRKLFFVINKADQLNPEEMDASGRRGPAKDLMRSLTGLVRNPEMFFVSSLYALVSKQLRDGHIQLQDIDHNNKIKIPFAVQMDLFQQQTPLHAIANYLDAQSNLSALESRVIEYLYREDAEGAIVEDTCRFVDPKAWQFARPLEAKMELARDLARMHALEREAERLQGDRDTAQQTMERCLNTFDTYSRGGTIDETEHASFEQIVDDLFAENTIAAETLTPLRRWLDRDENIRKASRMRYEPFLHEIQAEVDAFAERALAELNRRVEVAERDAEALGGEVLGDVRNAPVASLAAACGPVPAVALGMGRSFFAFATCGLALGAGIGAVATGLAQGWEGYIPGIGAAAGAGAGAFVGLLARAFSRRGAVRKRLSSFADDQVRRILVSGASGSNETWAALRTQLREAVTRRRTDFRKAVEAAFTGVIEDLQAQLAAIREEQSAVRTEQDALVARLEPKVARLAELGRRARAIARHEPVAAEDEAENA